MQTLFLTPAASRFDPNPNPSSVPACPPCRSHAPPPQKISHTMAHTLGDLVPVRVDVRPRCVGAITGTMRAVEFSHKSKFDCGVRVGVSTAVWIAGVVDRSGHSCRKSRPTACCVTKGRDRIDADHARDLGDAACSIMVSAMILAILTTTLWRAGVSASRCTTASVSTGFWLRTTQDRRATRLSGDRPTTAATRPAPTWPRSYR